MSVSAGTFMSQLTAIVGRYGISSLGNLVRRKTSNIATGIASAATTPIRITGISPQQMKAAAMLLMINALAIFIIVGSIAFTYILYRLFLAEAPRSVATDEDDEEGSKKNKQDEESGIGKNTNEESGNDAVKPLKNNGSAYTANVISSGVSALAVSGALIAAAFGVLTQVLTTSGTLLISVLPLLAPLVGVFIISAVVLTYNDTIFAFVNSANLNWIRPAFDYVINPILLIVLLGYQSIYGVWVTVLRIIAYLTYGPILITLQCSFNIIMDLVFLLGQTVVYGIYAIAFWIATNPIFSEIPLLNFFQTIGQFLSLVWTGPVSCFCDILNYLVGGIGKTFQDINLAEGLSNAVNFVWVTFAAFIVRPLITLQRPVVNRVYQLQSGTFVSLMKWLEAATTFQLDIYIYGGDETLVAQVNGTLPIPTDDMKYLVFFLQSEWLETIAHTLNAFIALWIWEPLNLAFQADIIFSANGASVFKWDMVRNETLDALQSLSTVIDIAPSCNNPGFTNVNFGSLVSPFAAIVWLIQATSDILIGEFYSLVVPPGQVPGFFLATYLLQQKLPLIAFETEVNNTADILGCILAYLDNALGKSLQGLLTAIIVWIPRIFIQILAFVRYILETGQVDVLDAVNVGQLEEAFLQIAVIGEVFFQFQPGATAITCPQTVSFFCAAGVGVEKFISFLFRAIIIIIQSVINLLKIVIQGIGQQTLAQVVIPDFTSFLEDGYAAGCRLGVILGTLIPLDIPCMLEQTSFCSVMEFPGQIDSTVSICFATVLCKVGNLLMLPIDVFTTAISYVATFDFTNSSLIVMAVKEVMSVIIFRVLSPICPLAHFFDCVFDAIVGGGQTAATGFFCLITGALVFLFNTLSDIIVQLLQWLINVIIFVFGGFTQSDAAKVFLDLIVQFFTIIGTSLEKLFLAILNIVLSIFFSILVTICRIVNFFIFFSITQQCNELEASLNNVLGGGDTNFLGPTYKNYKRTAETDDTRGEGGVGNDNNTGIKGGCGRTYADSIEMRAIETFDYIYNAFPSLDRGKRGSTLIDAERRRLGMPEFEPTCDKDGDSDSQDSTKQSKKKTTTPPPSSPPQPNFYDTIIRQTFGNGPTDSQQITAYLFRNVHWERTSNCYLTLKLLDGKKWDTEVGTAEKIFVMDCVKSKMIAAGLKNSYSVLSWLPEDIFYNTWFRSIAMGVGVARFSAVALNWASDRVVPFSVLMSKSYQDQWKSIRLDTSHYNETFLPLYPGPHANAYQYSRLITYIKNNATLQSYLRRNFPAIYDTTQLQDDPILSPLQDMYTFAGEFATETMRGIYTMANSTLNANETSQYGPRYPTNTLYYFGHDLNNRTAIALEYGEDALEAYDTRASSLALFESLSSFFTGLWTWGGEFSNLFVNRQGGQNFKRAVHNLSVLPSELIKNYPRLLKVANKRLVSNIENMIQNSRAFQVGTPRTLVVHSVENLSHLAAQWSGEQINAVPPWCLEYISKHLHISYDQVLPRYDALHPNNRKYIVNLCKNESWRQALKHIGVYVEENINTPPPPVHAFESHNGDDEIGGDPTIQMNDIIEMVFSLNPHNGTHSYESTSELLSSMIEEDRPSWRKIFNAIIGNEPNNNPLTRLMNVLKPKNEQARRNREILYRLATTTLESFWRAYYGIFGNDGTTMIERLERIQDDKVPDITTYFLSNNPRITTATLSSKNDAFATPHMQRYIDDYMGGVMNNDGIPWHVVNKDYQAWERDQQLNAVISSPENLKYYFFGETQIRSRGSSTHSSWNQKGGNMVEHDEAVTTARSERFTYTGQSLHVGAWRNKLTRLTQEYLYRDYDMAVIRRALEVQERNPKLARRGLIFKPHSTKMLKELGIERESLEYDPKDHGGQGSQHKPIIRIFSVFNRRATQIDENRWRVHDYPAPGHNPIPDAHANNDHKNNTGWYLKSKSGKRFQDGAVDIDMFLDETFKKTPIETVDHLGAKSGQQRVPRYYSIQLTNVILVDDGIQAKAFLNLTTILVKTCESQVTWLCENCYFLDQIVGLAITRAVYLYNYYTGYYIDLVVDVVPYLNYTYSETSQVISGNGTNSPWIPALNEPVGTFLQFTENEITNGLSFTHWIEVITGVQTPALVVNGSFYQVVYQYRISINPLTPLENNIFYDILAVIEFDLGFRILELIDTVVEFFNEDIENVAEYAVEHIGFCTYTVEIDCSQKQYSFAGGAIVALAYYAIVMAIVTLLFYPMPYMTGTIFVFLLISFPFFHAVITYGWSLRCIALPQCYFKDLWDLWVYTLYPKCMPVFGAFISSANYTADTCFNRNNEWEWVKCEDIGFKNAFDSLSYFQLWLGTDWGILEAFTPIFAQYGVSTESTVDFSMTPWDTDPVLYRNFGGCSVLTVIPYAVGAIALLVVAIVITASIIIALPGLISAIFITVFAIISFTFFAILDMDYSYVARKIEEGAEKDKKNRRRARSRNKTRVIVSQRNA